MTVPRNSVLFTSRAGWYRLDPIGYSATEPLDPTDWQYFSSYTDALQALNFNPLDILNYFDTSGFYNPISKVRAGLFVYTPTNALLKDLKDTYTYPVDDWTWFDSAQDAATAFSLPIADFNLDLY